MLEITIQNAFVIAVKLSWDYTFSYINQSDALCGLGNKSLRFLLNKPQISTVILAFMVIFGTTLCAFSMIILVVVLCLILIIIILEGLVIIIIGIMICQGLHVFVLSYTIFISTWIQKNQT